MLFCYISQKNIINKIMYTKKTSPAIKNIVLIFFVINIISPQQLKIIPPNETPKAIQEPTNIAPKSQPTGTVANKTLTNVAIAREPERKPPNKAKMHP